MKYSKLFGKTIKDVSSEETSINAKLLTRGGFIRREIAGVYNFLPLGLKVIEKIEKIVREEMNSADSQELLMPALQNKESWIVTGRWDTFDVLFKLRSQTGSEYPLGPSHEEVLVPLVKQFVSSYRDLPLSLYQIQTKFRDELRAKSGILRGREFIMKDLYSFHADEKDFDKYYKRMMEAYSNVFRRVGLDAILTEASGGAFSEFSHEYQVITESGEDEIIYCSGGDFAQNTEIAKVKEGKECDLGHGPLKKVKTIEVGNIFPLATKFSDAFGLVYQDENGKSNPIIMGCYGIGITRLMGTVVEVHNDEKGIVWPDSIAPYKVHLVNIGNVKYAEKAYEDLVNAGIEVLWDDRDVSAGEKFADADLIGIPTRIVVSDKLGEGTIEVKSRKEKDSHTETLEAFLDTASIRG
ncbi:MAG TPA: aminoacyl--tRNA ligase-related protein [Patescibacteria group bacterium]|nr:aminoacyl--tRNA ligase-related protein [Patescibacteria group bacterium]